MRPALANRAGQANAGYLPRHYNIGEHRLDVTAIFQNRHGFRRIAGFNSPIASGFENFRGHCANAVLVFHDKRCAAIDDS